MYNFEKKIATSFEATSKHMDMVGKALNECYVTSKEKITLKKALYWYGKNGKIYPDELTLACKVLCRDSKNALENEMSKTHSALKRELRAEVVQEVRKELKARVTTVLNLYL